VSKGRKEIKSEFFTLKGSFLKQSLSFIEVKIRNFSHVTYFGVICNSAVYLQVFVKNIDIISSTLR